MKDRLSSAPVAVPAPGGGDPYHAALHQRVRAAGLLLLIAGGFYLCWRLALPFLPALSWALALAVIFLPVYRSIERRGHRPTVAASLTMLCVTVLVAAPATLLVMQIVAEVERGLPALQRMAESGDWARILDGRPRLASAAAWVDGHFDVQRTVSDTTAWLANTGTALVRGSVAWVLGVVMTLYMLFYFLRDRERCLHWLYRLMPLSEAENRLVAGHVADTIHATVYGTLTVAALQGTLGGVMFWWLDLPAPLLWGIVMALLAIVPVLGAFLIWIPAAVFLALAGNWSAAAILTVWGTLVIGVIDNIVYPILVGNRLRLHTVPAFIAIVGGLMIFGTAGLVLGPLVLTTTLSLMQVWQARAAAGERLD